MITTSNFWDAMLCSLTEIYDFGGISEDGVIHKHIKNQHCHLHLHTERILVLVPGLGVCYSKSQYFL